MPVRRDHNIIRAEPTKDTKVYQDRVNEALRRMGNQLSEAGAASGGTPQRYGTIIETPTAAATYVVGRAVGAGTITRAAAYVTGGTSVTLNAQNAGLDIRSQDLVAAAATNFTTFGDLQNVGVAEGNVIAVQVVTITGAVTQCVIQVEVTPS